MIRDLILHNFWWKVLSIVLATIIWFAIKFGSQAGVSIVQNPITNPIRKESTYLAVNVLTSPGDARVFKVSPDRVLVTVTGESAVLRDYSWKNYKAYVDLTDTRNSEPGPRTVRLNTPQNVTATVSPLTVDVEQVSP